jgi:hypothetical protein
VRAHTHAVNGPAFIDLAAAGCGTPGPGPGARAACRVLALRGGGRGEWIPKRARHLAWWN